ncbi:hypothetical protein ACWPXT_04665 [Enterococcus faecium]
MITTGIRKGELAALHWSDIYFEEQLMYVRKSYATIRNEEKNARRKTVRIQKNTKNISSERILPIDAQTIEMLKIWKKEQDSRAFAVWHKYKYKKSTYLYLCKCRR